MNIYSVVFMGDTFGIFTSEKRAISRAKQIIYRYSDSPERVWENFVRNECAYSDEFELSIYCDAVDTSEEEFSL